MHLGAPCKCDVSDLIKGLRSLCSSDLMTEESNFGRDTARTKYEHYIIPRTGYGMTSAYHLKVNVPILAVLTRLTGSVVVCNVLNYGEFLVYVLTRVQTIRN
jgi:hypothetical protein